MKKRMMTLALGGLVVSASLAQAALIVDGSVNYNGGTYNLIYDDHFDITWLDYTNGGATFAEQQDWVASLSFEVNGTTYDQWRLPTTDYAGSHIDGRLTNNPESELSHLFYSDLGGNLNSVANPFSSLQAGATPYWEDNRAAFNLRDGQEYGFYGSNSLYYAIAVHDGRLSGGGSNTPVPEPATLLLMGSGLAGLAWQRRRRA